jgi:hypothetical protein
MTMQQSRIANLQRPILVRKYAPSDLPKLDEQYFDRLAAFGLACLAAAIVGKLLMTALTPQITKPRP